MKLTNISWFLLAAAILYIVFLRECRSTHCPDPPKPATVVIHDTVRTEKPVPIMHYVHDTTPGKLVFFPVKQTDTVFQNIPVAVIDSAVTIGDYFSYRVYKNTVKTKFGNIIILDTVTQNKLFAQSTKTDFTYQEYKPRNQLYVGLTLGSNGNTIGIGPDILFKTKADHIYGIGATLLPNQNIIYHASIYFKLHL